jgi:hypothetical protein
MISHQEGERPYSVNVPKYALACASYNGKDCQFLKGFQLDDHERFPWIHRRKLRSDDFHSENASHSINHLAVPMCRDPQAMLWFFHGSGGDSQL